MLSARLPSRLLRPVSLLACRSVLRLVPPIVPSFVSPRSSCRVAGREAGRAWSRSVSRVGGVVGRVGCLVGAGLFFRDLVVGLSVPLYQFPGAISDVGRAISGHSRLLASCSFSSHLVRFCPLLCVPRPACSSRAAVRLAARSSVPFVLSGGVVRRRAVACLPALVGAAVRVMSPILSRSAYRLFGTGNGEVWMPGAPSCLLGGGDDVDV